MYDSNDASPVDERDCGKEEKKDHSDFCFGILLIFFIGYDT